MLWYWSKARNKMVQSLMKLVCDRLNSKDMNTSNINMWIAGCLIDSKCRQLPTESASSTSYAILSANWISLKAFMSWILDCPNLSYDRRSNLTWCSWMENSSCYGDVSWGCLLANVLVWEPFLQKLKRTDQITLEKPFHINLHGYVEFPNAHADVRAPLKWHLRRSTFLQKLSKANGNNP